MKVSDISKRLGIPSSKIRYYDSVGLLEGKRDGENNYRNLSFQNGVDIYHSQMLRSFGMSIEESVSAKNKSIDEISVWVENHKQDLQYQIQLLQMKFLRLNQMQEYFKMVKDSRTKQTEFYDLEDSYNIYGLTNRTLTENEKKAVEILAENMPYSYIAIKITKESINKKQGPLEIEIGLGILQSNLEKISIELPKEIQKVKGGMKKHIILEVEDVFAITREDIKPLLEKVWDENGYIKDDLVGRIYISYKHNNKFVHGLGLGILCEK